MRSLKVIMKNNLQSSYFMYLISNNLIENLKNIKIYNGDCWIKEFCPLFVSYCFIPLESATKNEVFPFFKEIETQS